MKYVFGPVASRRLGRSLGVDPIPFKTCHWNCVYCQLGRTAPLRPERREYAPVGDVVAEVRAVLDAHAPGGIDWITFGGSGEPTLHSGIGRMIRGVMALTAIPIAVLTSGALLHYEEVRNDLLLADAVLPTLDAGSEAVYRSLNRPWPELTFESLVEGLMAFRAAYRGRLWVEVMLVRGVNDSDRHLEDIAAILRRVRPDQVHVNVPSRLPAEPWVEPPDPERLDRAAAILATSGEVVLPAEAAAELPCPEDPVGSLLAVLTRHAMVEEEVRRTLARWAPGQVDQTLAGVRATGQVRVVTRRGRDFWTHAAGRYS